MQSPKQLNIALIVVALQCALGSARLVFKPFPSSLSISCSDGSPAGIYVEEEDELRTSDPRYHLLVFSGGGACTSPSDCIKGYESEPFKFSTAMNPVTIEGDTILSNDPKLNEMHHYTKTMVPYCTQDFFLGDINKGRVGNFTHGGAAIMKAAVSAWSTQIWSQRLDSSTPEDGFFFTTTEKPSEEGDGGTGGKSAKGGHSGKKKGSDFDMRNLFYITPDKPRVRREVRTS